MITGHIDNTNKEVVTDANTPTHVNELPKTDDVKKITMRDVVVAELQRRIKISKDLQQIINTAKTKPKKDLYLKKIRKNNEAVADLLVALQRIDNQEKIKVTDEPKQQTDEDKSQLA